jgi:hypothetical protein
VLPLFQPTTSFLSLLCLSSLGISAWTLSALAVDKTGIVVLDEWSRPKSKTAIPQLGARIDKGPLEMYLPYLNLGLAGIILLAGLFLREGAAWPGFGVLPAAVYGFVLGAKVVMGSVDVGELEALKYGYKGA